MTVVQLTGMDGSRAHEQMDASTERSAHGVDEPKDAVHNSGMEDDMADKGALGEESAATVEVKVNLEATLPVMESRKTIRRWHGSYEENRPGVTWGLFIFFVGILLYSGAFRHHEAPDEQCLEEKGGGLFLNSSSSLPACSELVEDGFISSFQGEQECALLGEETTLNSTGAGVLAEIGSLVVGVALQAETARELGGSCQGFGCATRVDECDQERLVLILSVCVGANQPEEQTALIIVFVVILLLVFLLLRLQLLWNMKGAQVVTLLFIVLGIALHIRYNGKVKCEESFALGLGLTFVVAQGIILLVYFYVWRVLPYLQARGWVLSTIALKGKTEDATDMGEKVRSWLRKPWEAAPGDGGKTAVEARRTSSVRLDVFPVGDEPWVHCEFDYVGPFWKWVPMVGGALSRTITFSGPVDGDGFPHGWCTWKDSYRFGEQMFGNFEHGLPVGPFKSWESGSGSSFVNLRIGMLQNRGELGLNEAHCVPRHGDLRVSVAAVECSVSGAFYRRYPKVEVLYPAKRCADIAEDVGLHVDEEEPRSMELLAEMGMKYVVSNMLCLPNMAAVYEVLQPAEDGLDGAAEDADDFSGPGLGFGTAAVPTAGAEMGQPASPVASVLGEGGVRLHGTGYGEQGMQQAFRQMAMRQAPGQALTRLASMAAEAAADASECGGAVSSNGLSATAVDARLGRPSRLARIQSSSLSVDWHRARAGMPPQRQPLTPNATPAAAAAAAATALAHSSSGRAAAAAAARPPLPSPVRQLRRHGSGSRTTRWGGGGGGGFVFSVQAPAAAPPAAQAARNESRRGLPECVSEPLTMRGSEAWPARQGSGAGPVGEGVEEAAAAEGPAGAGGSKDGGGKAAGGSLEAVAQQDAETMVHPPRGPGEMTGRAATGAFDSGQRMPSRLLRASSLAQTMKRMSHAPGGGGMQAVVFVHGYNTPIVAAFKIFGQLMALANFPPTFMPFIFSWPCPSLFGFYAGQKKGAANPATSRSLESMLRALARLNFSVIHIITHSMGVRVVVNAVDQLERVFASDTSRARVKLGTITFMQPEFELMAFVRPPPGGGRSVGERLSALCRVLTIYGDQNDMALFVSELANSFKRTRTAACDMKDHFGSALKRTLHSDIASYTMPPHLCCWPLEPSLGRRIYHVQSGPRVPLDVDLVDTTFLQGNIDEGRHNGFVNRSVIEDLREVVVTCRRACERTSRLEQRGINVYGFLIAPTYIGTGKAS